MDSLLKGFKKMNIEGKIISAIKYLGNVRFTIGKIEELTELPRKKVSNALAKMAKKKDIKRVDHGVYLNKSIDLDKVDVPNTIEILPKFLVYNGWKVIELHELGFNLNYIKVVGQGTDDGKAETTFHETLQIPYNGRVEEITFHERITKRMYSRIIEGYKHDGLVPALAMVKPHYKFSIVSISITSKTTGDVIVANSLEDRLIIKSVNDTQFGNNLFDLDSIARILGDLYQATCSIGEKSFVRKMLCNPSL